MRHQYRPTVGNGVGHMQTQCGFVPRGGARLRLPNAASGRAAGARCRSPRSDVTVRQGAVPTWQPAGLRCARPHALP